MEETQINVTQSPYYSPVFNTAIFDGPFRVYFAQSNEAEALRIYYQMKKELEAEFGEEEFQKKSPQILFMIYPDQNSYELAFQESSRNDFVLKPFGDQYVLGSPIEKASNIHGPLLKVIRSIFSTSHLENIENQVSMEI